jgi:hypothetical protein
VAWDYDRSLKRIKQKHAEVADVQVSKLTREMDFDNVALNRPKRVHGAHVYVDVPNFPNIVGKNLEDGCEPELLEFGLHHRPQLLVAVQAGLARPAGPLPGAGMGQVAVIDVLVMRAQVAAQLSADCRRRAAQAPSDLSHAVPVAAQGRDPLAFQQRQIPARPRRLGQPDRWDPAVLGPPPVAGLAGDPHHLAGRHRPDAGLEQVPVLGLDLQLALAPSPAHSHTPFEQGCCDKP